MSTFGRISENTFNAMLTEELRKLGLEAYFEKHFTTLAGIKKPDIFVSHDGYYFIEAKQQPTKLVDAVSKAYTYKEAISTVTTPKACFGVLYPEEEKGKFEFAVLLDGPPFYMSHVTDSLTSLAQHIFNMITVPIAPKEVNTHDVIRLLNQAVGGLSVAFSRITTRDIEDIFGGKTFFESVLGYEEESKAPIQHLRAATAYLLVNQILFYQMLSRETGKYRVISAENIKHPAELQMDYFAKVLEVDYRPIFDFDVASRIRDHKSIDTIRTTINAVNALSPERHSHDILGKIFHNLIPLQIRKFVAAFFTSSEAGEILATLAVDGEQDTVIDPACGSGTLLVSAYRRKKDLLSKEREFGFENHREFVEKEITGIDIMPFAAHLAAVHLALQAPLYTTDNVRIAVSDSTTLAPGQKIEAAHEVFKEAFKVRRLTDFMGEKGKAERKEKAISGVVELTKSKAEYGIELHPADVVIMNPPFTRFQRIPTEYKKTLRTRFSDYKRYVHGQLGLHGYFLLLADKFLKGRGRMAAVLPVTTLSAKGFYGILDLWLEEYSIEYVITCAGRSAFSENALVREILFVAKKEPSSPDHKVGIIVVRKSPDQLTLQDAQSLAHEFRTLRKRRKTENLVSTDRYRCRFVLQTELKRNKRNLFKAISIYRDETVNVAEELSSLFKQSKNLTTFGQYLKFGGEIHESPRGIVKYGYYGLAIINTQARALKKHDFWIVKKTTKRQLEVQNRFTGVTFKIPKKSVMLNLRRLSGLKTIDVTENPDYIVVRTFKGVDQFLQNSISGTTYRTALSMLRNGEWEKFSSDHSSRLILLYRADITAPGTHHVIFHSDDKMFAGGSFWSLHVKPSDKKIMAMWFDSSINLFQMLTERKETRGGWVWFDYYVLDEFIVIDPNKLKSTEKKMLEKTFDKICRKPSPSILEQLKNEDPVRKDIDKAILRTLGMHDDQIEIFLKKLYTVLVTEIESLAKVMSGD